MIRPNYMTRFNQNTGNVACWHKGSYTEFICLTYSAYITLEVRLLEREGIRVTVRYEDPSQDAIFTLPMKSTLDEALKLLGDELMDYGFCFDWKAPQPLGI